MTTKSAQYLSTLHTQIDTHFSFNEVKTLCFDLGVDYENIPGNIRSAFIRNLLVSLAKQNRLQELVDKVRRERPFVDWQNVPANFALPAAVAQEDIRQIVQYTVYGDVIQGNVDKSTNTFNQQGQTVQGPQINAAGDANIGQIGDTTNSSGASANAQKTTAPPTSAETAGTPISTGATVQQAAAKLKRYLGMASGEYKHTADELAASINIILAVAAKQPVDSVHLNLLCLGQKQLAKKLTADVPGIEQVVAGFGTAVRQANS